MTMSQQSRYSDQQFEALMDEIIEVLEKNHADRNLSLMVLGNLVTNILEQQVQASDRREMAEKFAQVLVDSVK